MGDVQESVATREEAESSEQPATSEEQRNPEASQSSLELAESSATASATVAADSSPGTDSLQNTNQDTQATSQDINSSSNVSTEPKPNGAIKDQQHPDHSTQPAGVPSIEVESTQDAESAVKIEPDSKPESDSKELKVEPDPRSTLRHVLADPSPPRASSEREPPSEERATQPAEQETVPTASPRPSSASQSKDRPATPQAPPEPAEGANQPNLAAITYTLRKNANGGFSTVYSGSRIKYLKKDDGLPFWRSDIQYAMLKHIFEDKTRVFTKYSNGTTGHTFCEIYVDAMANSSKCSQTLKEKLLFEYENAEQAIDLAMVCLLVNVGRMNTTVNFFPEMRARVRTFHPIPCLQANTNPSAYKQLQDGPRLKSILKGAMEDMPQPSSLEQLVTHPKPRTNPVNLIFVLAQYAPRVSDLHFPSGMDFFDLFMRNNLSSKSRATAFLWMVWWYLESDFTAADSQRNPFGLGQPKRTPELAMSAILSMIGVDTRVPEFETLSEEDAAKENEDPQNELDYGEAKRLERQRILSTDAPKRSLGAAEDHHSYASPSHPADDPPRSSYADHHYRNSHHHHPKGSSYYNSSPSHAGHARDRRSPSPHRSRAFGDHRSRGQDIGHDPTRSQSPSSVPDRRSGGGRDSFYHHRGASPDEEPRRGPGRGNYTRRQKLHPIQPFEQMYRPDQFENGTSAPPGYHHTQEWGSKSSMHPNGYSPSSRHSEAHRVPAGDQGHHYGPASSRERLWRGTSHPSGSHHSEPPSLAPAPSGSPDEDGHHSRSNERRHSMQRRQYYHDRGERTEKRVGKDLHTTGKKRTRPTAEQARTAEQERHDRVIQILEANANAIKTAKRQERKRRGPIVDAWIKCRALPEGYDSEDDELNRMGGIDDYRREGTEDISEATLNMTLGNEGKVVMWNAGDVGQQSESIARLWRRVARINGAGDIVERERARLRGEDGYEDEYFDRELENGDMDIEHALKGRRGGATQAAADRSSILIEDDDDSIAAEPAPKKRRKPMVKRGKLSGPSRTGDMRKVKRTSVAAGKQKRTSGVPTDQFFGNGTSNGPASSKLKGRGKMRTGAATRRPSGPRAKRQAPSAKESEVEEDKTELEQKDDEDMKQESADEAQGKGEVEAEGEAPAAAEDDEVAEEIDKELLAEADADGSDHDRDNDQKNDTETALDDFVASAEPARGMDGDTEMTVDA